MQSTVIDGSEVNRTMVVGLHQTGKSRGNGIYQRGPRRKERTQLIWREWKFMTILLEVLIGVNVMENLTVMVDNQSILREINRWVGEGDRTFLVNPESWYLKDVYRCHMVFSWIHGQKTHTRQLWIRVCGTECDWDSDDTDSKNQLSILHLGVCNWWEGWKHFQVQWTGWYPELRFYARKIESG